MLDRFGGSLWASLDPDYAAAFAQLYEGALWMLTLDVADGEVLDLTGCGLDVSAVATDLMFAGIAARVEADDERHPQKSIAASLTRCASSSGLSGRAHPRMDRLGRG
jgi:hypothetical protein